MVTIREATVADAPGIGEVYVASWRTTYPGIVPQEITDSLKADESARRWAERLTDPEYGWRIFVAEDEGGRVVGFASGGAVRDSMPEFDGELYAVYLLKEAQGRGIGRKLVESVARRLHEDGYRSMVVWVLAANQARLFYEALGGREVAQKQITIGEPLDSICYGWPEISVLTGDAENERHELSHPRANEVDCYNPRSDSG